MAELPQGELTVDLSAPRPELYGSFAFVNCLDQLAAHVQLPGDRKVLYPGSSTHSDVADYFGRNNVVHVDLSAESMHHMAARGYQAVTGDLMSFPGQQYDIVVALNTTNIMGPNLVKKINPQGYLITNMHELAEWMVDEGLLAKITIVDSGEASMGPHFQENSLGLYQASGKSEYGA